jgi:hypothetical protein
MLLGAAVGLRATALLMIGYAGLAVLASLRPPFARREAMAFLAESTLRLLPAFVVAYAIMALAWPWSWQSPLNPLRAIFAFAHFHYDIRTIVAGHVYVMSEAPRWYVPLYLAVKLPLFLIVGALVAVAPAIWSRLLASDMKAVRPREVLLLAFMVGFPVACQVIARGPAFTGMRHFLFVVPPLAVLAGIGLELLLRRTEQHGRSLARLAHVVLAAVVLWQAGLLIRLHPQQYLFYNSLVGGLEGASRRYVTDYWVNLMPEAAQALAAYVDRTDPNARAGRYTVAVCGERLAFEKEADARFSWTGGWLEADFFIAPTHMNCDWALNGPTAVRIERLGVLIGVVQDLRGIPAQARGFAITAPQ